MRLAIALVLGGTLGCEREVPFEPTPDQPINGYQLEGYVTDRLGTPVRGLRIALWYDYGYIDSNDPPPRQFTVSDSTMNLIVSVRDAGGNVRRILFEGHTSVGAHSYSWDQKDSFGDEIPSGVYTVDFSVNGVSKYSYTVIVDGAVSAVTDSLGHYVIPNDLLPVGFYPAPLYGSDDSTFVGNYQITSYVTLEFYLGGHPSAGVSLTQDQVTRFDYNI
jgi:hypothetical protein